MHLRYRMYEADDCGVTEHPQVVMKALGISYQHATPQSIYDQWWFWNCEGVPEKLPEYLQEFNGDPFKVVGWGLSLEDAEKIVKGKGDLSSK